jgi:hypothetical protein
VRWNVSEWQSIEVEGLTKLNAIPIRRSCLTKYTAIATCKRLAGRIEKVKENSGSS